jgi:hypothetical protein
VARRVLSNHEICCNSKRPKRDESQKVEAPLSQPYLSHTDSIPNSRGMLGFGVICFLVNVAASAVFRSGHFISNQLLGRRTPTPSSNQPIDVRTSEGLKLCCRVLSLPNSFAHLSCLSALTALSRAAQIRALLLPLLGLPPGAVPPAVLSLLRIHLVELQP